MRHKRAFRKLGRTMEHRKALRRNMAMSLFEHGQIRTTAEKAKDLRPFAERLITLAKRAKSGDQGARRRIHRLLGERYFIPTENLSEYEEMSDAARRNVMQSRAGRRYRTGEPRKSQPFTAKAISFTLINDIAERYQSRQGGYTRIIHLAGVRLGDHGQQAIVQLVGEEDVPSNVPKAARSARKRRADARYSAVVKLSKKQSSKDTETPSTEEA